MALTETEEALLRELLAEKPELDSLADNEAAIISKLAGTKIALADLTAASIVNGTDLTLIVQGGTAKNATIGALVASISTYGSAKLYGTYAAASAASHVAGDAVIVFGDAGTHTDPVVGGTVQNEGVYIYSASPAGLERVEDLVTQVITDAEANAVSAADTATQILEILNAIALGVYYTSTASGIAGTVDGEYFGVVTNPGVNGLSEVYLNNAGTAVLQWQFATTAGTNSAIDALETALALKIAVTPEEYGAVAVEDGGTTSQTTAIANAMNSGRLVNCNGKTYILGAPVVPGGTVKGIVNGQFQWLNTTVMAQQQFMLSIIDKDDLIVADNVFNLGTVENCGSNNDSTRGAVKISSSNEGVTYIKRPRVERNRVTGGGNGTAIYVRSAIDPRVNFNNVHDRIVDGTPANDAQNGIDTSRSNGGQCIGNVIDGLYYRIGGTPTRAWSRGIVVVELTGGVYTGNIIRNVDQGIDYSGGIISGFPNGNTNITCTGNMVSDVRTYGIKFANCIRDSVCTGNTVTRFGWGGIVVSGQSSAWTGSSTLATQGLLIANNRVTDPSDYYSRTDCIGVWIIQRALYPGYPSEIRIAGNYISDSTGGGRLLHGISQDDGDGAHNIVAGAPHNEVVGNRIIGQTGTPTKGIAPTGLTILTGDSSQLIATATWTAALWNVETADGEGAHSTSTNTELFTASIAGWYRVDFHLLMQENATGNRQARIQKNGASVPGGDYANAGLTGANVTINGGVSLYLDVGDTVKVEVYQNSGISLNLLRPNSQFAIRRLEQM